MMGFSLVELIVDIEKAFDIEISDAEVPKIKTVGDVHKAVLAKLRSLGEEPSEDQVLEKLKDVIAKSQSLDRDIIVKDAELIYDLGIG